MNDGEILTKLQGIFDDLFQESQPVVRPELSANDVEEWDSLMNVQLMVAAEQEFGISIAAAEVENLQSVADLVNLIKSKL